MKTADWEETLNDALGGHGISVLLATAGRDGEPHLATADRILPDPQGLIQVSGWLCPTTIRNLRENSKLALVVRGAVGGVEIEGTVTEMEEDAVLDGYVAEERPPPRVRWILHVHPERFLRFENGLHSDEPP